MKKTAGFTLIFIFSGLLGFIFFEAGLVKSASDSITVTQLVTSEISISTPDNVSMSPAIPGMTGGTATGSATWNVETGDSAGFNMKLKASTSPALVSGGNSFADYTEASSNVPDYNWSIATTVAEFGYTVEPATDADAVAAFLDNGTDACNTGSTQTVNKCWLGFTDSDFEVINRSSATSESGENEVVKFQAQSGAANFQPEGSYTATITATAVTN